MSPLHRTRYIKNTLCPFWDENFICDGSDQEGNLLFEVWDHDTYTRDDLIGTGSWSVANLRSHGTCHTWVELCPKGRLEIQVTAKNFPITTPGPAVVSTVTYMPPMVPVTPMMTQSYAYQPTYLPPVTSYVSGVPFPSSVAYQTTPTYTSYPVMPPPAFATNFASVPYPPTTISYSTVTPSCPGFMGPPHCYH
eukprot:TRINITY_DN10441_c0_g1_i9.p1 TRINITY_DN10441_c0_g1~~TRINITY_DN10441_c0_g1_i9.p1  ORF type:complete len:193 (+),score=25.66 TRINITY_DN10441_c0_g1_i9:302-880(+)